MKELPEELVGKRISGVVLRVAKNPRIRPQGQLFLCFDDGTSFEFWSGLEEIHPAGGLDDYSVETVANYMSDVMSVARQVPRLVARKNKDNK
jgi:hypothetical protein